MVVWGGGKGRQTPSNIQELAGYDSQQTVHISCVLFNAITRGRASGVICFVSRCAAYEDGQPKSRGNPGVSDEEG